MHLTNLVELSLNDNENVEIKSLQFLIKLTKLGLAGCYLTNLNTLQYLTNLIELNLNDNENIDINPLQYLAKLTILGLERCRLTKLNSLRSLVSLEQLYLQENQGIDITPLQYLKKLKKLQLNYCDLDNIEALRPLVELQELQISLNSIISIQPVNQLKQIYILNTMGNKIIDFQAIQTHPHFQEFVIVCQHKPTKEQLLAGHKMTCISYSTDSFRSTKRKLLNKFKVRLQNKHRLLAFQDLKCVIVCQHKPTKEQSQFIKQSEFITQVAQFFQKLSYIDEQ
ncbi:leucine-rich_repeat domain-containing protein [Hexamita inflata]|uniref:Leucine-rich repeat domain-containing protein n=1 Tax=Hexamita inflata TaxID=28002 RepID=A0AA86N620_9EUKA|nr:leucine-rich repeat domain-containing protein [Hexamita inflata]